MEYKTLFLIAASVVAGILSGGQSADPNAATPPGVYQYEPTDGPIDATEPPEQYTPPETYTPVAPVCNCDGCCSQEEVRAIVKTELARFATTYKTKPATTATTSGGSSGNAMVSRSAIVLPAPPLVVSEPLISRAYSSQTVCELDSFGNAVCRPARTTTRTTYRRGLFGWRRR